MGEARKIERRVMRIAVRALVSTLPIAAPFCPATPSTAESAPPIVGVGLFGDSDICECVLNRIHGARNDMSAAFVWQSCLTQFENKCWSRKGSWFGMTYQECMLKYAHDVKGEIAINLGAASCSRLFGD
jgi:hypothetical protein